MHINTILHIRNATHVFQVIGTAALLLCVLALGDRRNGSLPDGLQPVLVGGAVLVIGISMGSNSGYALNPARDFGPRFFTYIAGWGEDVFMLVVFQTIFLLFNINDYAVFNYTNFLSLQGWKWMVVGSYCSPLCWRAAWNIDLPADD